MSLLSRISAPTREVGDLIDEASRHRANRRDELMVANDRIRQLETEIHTLRAGMPLLSAGRREDALRDQVAQLTRNLTAMEDRLAVAEGRDSRIRHGFVR